MEYLRTVAVQMKEGFLSSFRSSKSLDYEFVILQNTLDTFDFSLTSRQTVEYGIPSYQVFAGIVWWSLTIAFCIYRVNILFAAERTWSKREHRSSM